MAQKSKMYFITRSFIRGLVRALMLFAAYIVIHLATYSVWTFLLFMFIVASGFIIYEHKSNERQLVPVRLVPVK